MQTRLMVYLRFFTIRFRLLLEVDAGHPVLASPKSWLRDVHLSIGLATRLAFLLFSFAAFGGHHHRSVLLLGVNRPIAFSTTDGR